MSAGERLGVRDRVTPLFEGLAMESALDLSAGPYVSRAPGKHNPHHQSDDEDHHTTTKLTTAARKGGLQGENRTTYQNNHAYHVCLRVRIPREPTHMPTKNSKANVTAL